MDNTTHCYNYVNRKICHRHVFCTSITEKFGYETCEALSWKLYYMITKLHEQTTPIQIGRSIQRDIAMIEFKGSYYQSLDAKPTPVLVQFDSVLLHVWHLSDPFYRLFSSDVFHISKSLRNKCRHIKLPNGGRITTDDLTSLTLLHQQKDALSNMTMSNYYKYMGWIAMLSLAFMLLTAWLILRHGISF